MQDNRPRLQGFICYAHADYDHFKIFRKHLKPIEQSYSIEFWCDEEREGRIDLSAEIKDRIERAHIVVFLISSDSLYSDYIIEKELPLIKLQKNRGRALFIGVVLNRCNFEICLGTEHYYLPIRKGKLAPISDSKWGPTEDGHFAACNGISDLLKKRLGRTPRPGFEEDGRDELGGPLRAILQNNSSEITDLVLESAEITDLGWICGCSNLRRLVLRGLEVPDLSAVGELTQLESLALPATQTESLAPLAKLRSLRDLDVTGTRVSDLMPLARFHNLQRLNLTYTPASDLAPLKGLKKLNHLDLDTTDAQDITPLANLVQLQYLDLAQTKVSDIFPLAGLRRLRTLNLKGTQVSDLRPIAKLANLERLYLCYNKNVTTLTPLASLRALRELNVRKTSAVDLSPVKQVQLIIDRYGREIHHAQRSSSLC